MAKKNDLMWIGTAKFWNKAEGNRLVKAYAKEGQPTRLVEIHSSLWRFEKGYPKQKRRK